MTDYEGPILDNHLHIDPDQGKGLEAVKEFARAGGTHLLIVNKPSWHLGIEVDSKADFRPVFEKTIDIANTASDHLQGKAWPILGVHPSLISHLVDERKMEPEEAAELMQSGITAASDYIDSDDALALKSGRPHYDVTDTIWTLSNEVLQHTLRKAKEVDCPVQLHTESSKDLTEIANWATEIGLSPQRVVKHYAYGELAGLTPSVMSEKDRLRTAAKHSNPFLMETDFVDDPDRPGAVLGPKTVPRRVRWLAEQGHINAIRRAHIDTPRS
ncbi:MAG: TatD family hydrolase, partial [Halobacteriaceae archaeon]